jgi:NAD(P)-dependent dehydrogenase (short-subunit alcohol dehydrogenase family)
VRLAGSGALVTGGAAGIGRAVAERLAKEGAAVVIADRDEAAGKAAAADLGATFVHADVATDGDVRWALTAATARLGGLDILVNNAGGIDPPYYPDAPVERWSHALDLNLRAVMLATQLALESMTARGGGAIVNIASSAGLGLEAHRAPEYAAAKAGVVRLTATLAPLSRRLGVRVNCICPHLVDTPSSRRDRAGMTPEELAALPPAMAPEEIAAAVAELIADDQLAGRVMVCQAGVPPSLLPVTA